LAKRAFTLTTTITLEELYHHEKGLKLQANHIFQHTYLCITRETLLKKYFTLEGTQIGLVPRNEHLSPNGRPLNFEENSLKNKFQTLQEYSHSRKRCTEDSQCERHKMHLDGP
jgi:hypothetical protein